MKVKFLLGENIKIEENVIVGLISIFNTKGFTGSIPIGGHCAPSSIVGVRAL